MDRVRSLQRALSQRGEVAALITSPENVQYFTGFYVWNSATPFALALIPVTGEPILFVPRTDEPLAYAVSRAVIEAYDPAPGGFKTTAERCRAALERMGITEGALGAEFGALTLDRARLLEEVFPRYTLDDITAPIADLRIVKDPGEQIAFKRAAELVGLAMQQTIEGLRPGAREMELKATLDLAVCTEGARRWPDSVVRSQTNVVTGPKANRLHDAATGRVIGPGEVVFIMGMASVDGYWANVARTVFAPGARPRLDVMRVLDVAVRAQRAAVSRLAPGIPLGEAVRAADDILAGADLLQRKAHPMFRGLGLRTDERPRAMELGTILKAGVCLCAQLYLRSEDCVVGHSDSVLITDDGAAILTARNHLKGGQAS